MNRLFQHQEHKKANGIHQKQLKSSKPIVSSQMHPIHSAILNLQQTYGNRYVQGVVEGDRMPCRELCGQNGPSLTAHLAPHSCGSCPFHTRSIKQMTPGIPSSRPTQPIQAKLKIGRPGDVYEQEADRVADMVLQRQCTTSECEEEETVQRKTITPLIQRQIESEEEEEEPIQMKQMAPEKEVSQDVDEQILQQKGIGRPLEPETRKFMEARLGYDFGGVRVHTDSYAARESNELNAEAFTIGRDVFFSAGRYNPSATEGKRLLAHELTHVIQQESQPDLVNKKVLQRQMRRATAADTAPVCTNVNFVVPPAAEHARVDAAIAIIERVINNPRDYPRCPTHFRDHCVPGTNTSLQDQYNRSIVWKIENYPAGWLGGSCGTSPNIGYTDHSYRWSHWAIAASLVHEMMHICGVAGHPASTLPGYTDICDEAKHWCGRLPNL